MLEGPEASIADIIRIQVRCGGGYTGKECAQYLVRYIQRGLDSGSACSVPFPGSSTALALPWEPPPACPALPPQREASTMPGWAAHRCHMELGFRLNAKQR